MTGYTNLDVAEPASVEERLRADAIAAPASRIHLNPRHDGRSYREQKITVADRPGHDKRYAIDEAFKLLAGGLGTFSTYNITVIPPDGATIQGSGWIPGYAVVNLQSTVHVAKDIDVFARLVDRVHAVPELGGKSGQNQGTGDQKADQRNRLLARTKQVPEAHPDAREARMQLEHLGPAGVLLRGAGPGLSEGGGAQELPS